MILGEVKAGLGTAAPNRQFMTIEVEVEVEGRLRWVTVQTVGEDYLLTRMLVALAYSTVS